MTEEMSGGLRHHSDEASGPELCGWIQQSSKQGRYRLDHQCQRAEGKLCDKVTKTKFKYILTSPTSLEMLQNPDFTQNPALRLKACNRWLHQLNLGFVTAIRKR